MKKTATLLLVLGLVVAVNAAPRFVQTDADSSALQGKLDTDGNGSSLTGLTAGQVGLGNVDNTSDADKPISTVQGATNTVYDGLINANTAKVGYTQAAAEADGFEINPVTNLTAGTGITLVKTDLSYEVTATGGGGDFLADGSVPMTGNLNFGGNSATNATRYYFGTSGVFMDVSGTNVVFHFAHTTNLVYITAPADGS